MGVLLLVVISMLVGWNPAAVLIAVALAGFVLERLAPRQLDQAIDLLRF
jgi:uncharacterized membrane protein